jgi:hypothetical protein
MILDEFRKKNQRNQTSDEEDINFRRWLSTEINKVFWERAHGVRVPQLVHHGQLWTFAR